MGQEKTRVVYKGYVVANTIAKMTSAIFTPFAYSQKVQQLSPGDIITLMTN